MKILAITVAVAFGVEIGSVSLQWRSVTTTMYPFPSLVFCERPSMSMENESKGPPEGIDVSFSFPISPAMTYV